MILESFLPNLALFVAGQAAAWFYLRTGRLWLGGVAMATMWIAADWALVARYVFDDVGGQFRVALLVMQVAVILMLIAVAFAQWRRRWSKTARNRGRLFGQGMERYLRGAHDESRQIFVRLVRSDPWDAAAWLALGNVLHRLRQPAAARRCYRRCLRVDVNAEYGDLAKVQLEAAAVPPAEKRLTKVTGRQRQSSPTPAHPARS